MFFLSLVFFSVLLFSFQNNAAQNLLAENQFTSLIDVKFEKDSHQEQEEIIGAEPRYNTHLGIFAAIMVPLRYN